MKTFESLSPYVDCTEERDNKSVSFLMLLLLLIYITSILLRPFDLFFLDLLVDRTFESLLLESCICLLFMS